jgi:hypothetical protein
MTRNSTEKTEAKKNASAETKIGKVHIEDNAPLEETKSKEVVPLLGGKIVWDWSYFVYSLMIVGKHENALREGRLTCNNTHSKQLNNQR